MRAILAALLGAIVVCWAPYANAADAIPREKIQDAIREGVERIIKTQRADGAYILDSRRFNETTAGYTYAIGVVGLGVLAVEHALPHLEGDLAVRARESVSNAIKYIRQRKLERKTYSAAMGICALYSDHPKKHSKMIGDYAEMLVISQHRDLPDLGAWGYYLHPPLRILRREQKNLRNLRKLGPQDHSNTQFAVLGLLFAHRSGYQVPKKVWQRLGKHLRDTQKKDGGWAYRTTGTRKSYANMTLACTISLAICEEMLFAKGRHQCKPPARSGAVQRGIDWISSNLNYGSLETYGFYATERLGILSGRSEFGGKSWFDEGAKRLLANRKWPSHGAYQSDQQIGAALAVLFLSRGLEPVIFNKLERKGTDDWNNDPYDVKHLTEYISKRFQHPKQWRIVTLDADVDFLARVPILFVSGHNALKFDAPEKAKLKEYVQRGGTIFGMACCGKPAFDKSFRELVAELWPEEKLDLLTKTHAIYSNPRPLRTQPKLLGLALPDHGGRLGVIYSPYDLCCKWQKGGSRAKPHFDLGTNLFFYVDKIGSKLVPGKKRSTGL